MFTGIIENIGRVSQITGSGTNRTFWIESPLSEALKVDQSIAHDGVCLTIEEIKQGMHRVTAVSETLDKTNLRQWKTGSRVNLERSLNLNSRLDGHFVQGHVDATGTCENIINKDGSYEFEFAFPDAFAPLVIEKGSICINGVSLTAWNVSENRFKVAVIPYTFQHTNLGNLKEKDQVNLEFDMIGKYILRNISLKK